MATGTYVFLPQAAVFPDGSTGNLAPGISFRQGSESSPKKHYYTLDFDAAQDEHAWWTGVAPADYASGGAVDLAWHANATSGTVRWGVSIGAISSGDADTPLEHANAAASTAAGTVNTTEARRLTITSITLSNPDSLAAGDLFFLLVYRDGDGTSGTDDCTVDAELVAARWTYTTT